MIFKTRPDNGETAVFVVKFKKIFFPIRQCNDSLNYTHPSIVAVIPCWKSDAGYISIKTGKPVNVDAHDEVRQLLRGTVIRYPDGTEMIYGLNFRDNVCEFIEHVKSLCEVRKCFGE